MKKTIIFIFVLLLAVSVNIYAAENLDYLHAHLREIKGHTNYNIKNIEKYIENNSASDLIEILKKIYGSIDSYSTFYSGDELKVNIFDKNNDSINKSIEYEIKDDIGYIYIYTFNDNIYDKTVDILKIMDDEKINKIVLDLRNNSGGDIMESIKTAKLFVKEGLIAKIHYYSQEIEDKEYYSNLKELKYNLIVLVNEETASAAELFAGAVQDSESGYLVGSKTFGKAKTQKMIPVITEKAYIRNELYKEPTVNLFKAMDHGSIIYDEDLLGWAKLTVGCFYNRSGKEIDGKGIEPDYVYSFSEGEEYMKILFNELFALPKAIQLHVES
ncbi:S41 family peptidase [Lutispora sp.]|uniref:S41 family peptidase n=1 Tax=Lutispora sp. TaxID=2828727 RepID=UPI00356133EC